MPEWSRDVITVWFALYLGRRWCGLTTPYSFFSTMTINNSLNASIETKDVANNEQNDPADVQNTTTAPTDVAESTQSSDPLPQGVPPTDARPITPPTGQPRVLEEDTPSIIRSAHTADFRNGTLDYRRKILVDEFQYVDVVDDEFFFSNLLPSVPETILGCMDAVVKDLKNKNHLTDPDEAWKAFNDGKKEDAHFMPFTDIFKDVVSSVQKHAKDPNLEATHWFKMEPHTAPRGGRDEEHRPDAYFVKDEEPADGDKEKGSLWYDIACVGEFKKAESDKATEDVSLHFIIDRPSLTSLPRIFTKSCTECTTS